MKNKLRFINVILTLSLLFTSIVTTHEIKAEVTQTTWANINRMYARMTVGAPLVYGLDATSVGLGYHIADQWHSVYDQPGIEQSVIFPGGGTAVCAAGNMIPIAYDSIDDFASAMGEGWWSNMWAHAADEIGHAPTNTTTHRMVVNNQPFEPLYVKHGLTVRRNADGELKLFAAWAYTDEEYSSGNNNTWYTAVQFELTGPWPDPRPVNPTSTNDGIPDISWVNMTELNGYTFNSPIINGKIPDPPMDPDVNNVGYLEEPLEPSVNSPFLRGTPFNPNDNLHVVGAVTGESLNLADNPASMITHDYRLDLTDTTGIDHLLSSNKQTFTGIGDGSFKAKVTDYEGDITHFERPVAVKTDSNGGLGVTVKLTGNGQAYNNEWMSNHGTADSLRRAGLTMQGNSTIPGNYDLVTQLDGTRISQSGETKSATAELPFTNGERTGVQHPNTDANGIPVTSQALQTGEHDNALSPQSNPIRVRYDNTPPTISAITTNADWTAITGHNAADGLNESGLEDGTGGVYYRIVNNDDPDPSSPSGSDAGWSSDLSGYTKPTAPGTYTIWVYAKDNATNRSKAVPVGTFTVEDDTPKTALIRLKKEVTGTAGDKDIFLISMREGSTLLTSVALKHNETSGVIELDMGSATSKNINISEIIPMDYDANFTISVTNQSGSPATVNGKIVTVKPGDNLTIVVKNTLAPSGYFKGKDFVKNLFES